jgi:NAD(P)-dependent dehydrogenase (short-subunit alcohol dehydrogenase family)
MYVDIGIPHGAGDEIDDNQVSKAAAVHVTRQLAYDLSHKNINVRVNGIAPGMYRRLLTSVIVPENG